MVAALGNSCTVRVNAPSVHSRQQASQRGALLRTSYGNRSGGCCCGSTPLSKLSVVGTVRSWRVLSATGRGCRVSVRASMDDVLQDELARPAIMINDISGRMGFAVGEATVEAGLTLLPVAFTKAGNEQTVACAGVDVECINPDDRVAALKELHKEHPNLVVVDFTVPSVVNEMASLYCKAGVPFVMGTTGGDREELTCEVLETNTYAVIAPQMGKQVVAFQAAMIFLADQFPGCFKGYKMEVVESHQSAKVDTSGTAKAIVASFQDMGVVGPNGRTFELEDIEKVRVAEESIGRMGVPEEHIPGHAYHTYKLTSPDGLVTFQFQHNVCGRSIYANGSVDAALFLYAKLKEGSMKRLFNMVDVLGEGSMR